MWAEVAHGEDAAIVAAAKQQRMAEQQCGLRLAGTKLVGTDSGIPVAEDKLRRWARNACNVNQITHAFQYSRDMPFADMPRRSLRHTLALLALWVVFYGSFTLLHPALLDDADSVHAEVAREMLLRHDWVTLYANGIRYLEKAPLLYWSMATSFKVFGVSTAAARIPNSLTILALAFVVEAFASRAFRSARAGLYAALILLSSFGIFIFTRINLPDAMVCLWLTLAMYAFWLTEQQEHPSLLQACIFSACCAMGVLTKGLIGLLFPACIVALYLTATRGWRGFRARMMEMHPLALTLVFVVIVAPWHVLIALANHTQGHPGGLTFAHGHWFVPLPTDGNVHGWLWFYFVNEQVLRYLNLRVPRDYDTVPLWLFWGLCLVWLMPWSAYLFHAICGALPLRSATWRKAFRNRSLSAQQKTYLLLTVWAAFPMIFFSLSTRQEYYVLPALPALILLTAGFLDLAAKFNNSAELPAAEPGERVTGQLVFSAGENEATAVIRSGVAANRIGGVLLSIGTALAAAAAYFLLHTRTPSANTDLAALLQQNPGDYALSMGHFLDLNSQALGLFRLPLAIAAASLFFGPLISYVLRKRAKPHAAALTLAAGAFGFLLAAHLGLQTFAPVLSSQQLAAAIAPQLHADDLIVIHQEYEYASTLGFYLRRPGPVGPALHILEGRSSNLWYGSFFADAPQIFETPQSLAQKWSGAQRIFLWQDLANQPSPLPTLPAPVYVIAKSGGKEIVSNRPNN
jgi:4-amino-4-deoxy-L-arabinose transferase-like glycosyltransferase